MSELIVYVCRHCGTKVGERIKDVPVEEAAKAVENTLKESGFTEGTPEYEKHYERLLREKLANVKSSTQIPEVCPSCGKLANYEEIAI
jgi:ribosomal protein L37AE/L43A